MVLFYCFNLKGVYNWFTSFSICSFVGFKYLPEFHAILKFITFLRINLYEFLIKGIAENIEVNTTAQDRYSLTVLSSKNQTRRNIKCIQPPINVTRYFSIFPCNQRNCPKLVKLLYSLKTSSGLLKIRLLFSIT